MVKKPHKKAKPHHDSESGDDIENELKVIEEEHKDDSNQEEYDSELDKDEALYIKKLNIQKKNLFEED